MRYLKTTGAFNWSTHIASFRFPVLYFCPGVGNTYRNRNIFTKRRHALWRCRYVKQWICRRDERGRCLLVFGSARNLHRNGCRRRPQLHAAPRLPIPTVTITSGGTATQNFTMVGTSNLEENGVTIDDTASGGNGNGVINRNECVNLNVELKNNGCANATASSATLTTTTPGVTVVQGNSNYPDMVIDATGTNSTPFKIQTASNFACGTEIEFDLNLTFPNGSKTIHITVPTCTGGANATIPPSTLDVV